MIDRAGAVVAARVPDAAARRCTWSPASSTGTRSAGAIGCPSLRMAGPLRLARRALRPGARLIAASPDETVDELADSQRTDAAAARAAVGAARARRAEPAARPRRPRRPSRACSPRCSARDRARRRDRAADAPAAPDVRGAGARVHRAPRRTRAHRRGRAPSRCATAAVAGVTVGGERLDRRRRHVRRPLVRAAGRSSSATRRDARRDARSRAPHRRRRRSSPSTCGSTGACSTSRSSACPGARCSGCSTSGRCSATRRRTCRSCRAAPPASCSSTNEAIVALAHRELVEALPVARERAAAARDRRSASRARRFRSRPASRRVRRPRTGVRGLFLAGDWIDTGLPATIESAVRSGHLAAHARRIRKRRTWKSRQ